MFKGLQKVIKERTIKQPSKARVHQLYNSSTLLKEKSRQKLVEQFQPLISLNDENYAIYCQPLINRFVEFVQLLPETHHSYYSKPGGYIDHAFERTTAAMKKCRAYFLPAGSDNAALTQPQTLWAYTLFSASLLLNIGRLITDLIVEITDKDGKLIATWQPLDGPMQNLGTHYHYEFDDPQPDTFRRQLSILLARQLMPIVGMQWIASDKDVFSVWLALLDEDTQGAGTFGPILSQADAYAIQKFLTSLESVQKTKKGSRYSELSTTFVLPEDLKSDSKASDPSSAGKEFLVWLKQTMLNNPSKLPIHHVPGGALLTSEVFQLFARESDEYKSWQAVQESFTGLGLNRIGPNNTPVLSFIQLSHQTKYKGVVIGLALVKELSSSYHGKLTKQKSEFVQTPSKLEIKPSHISTTGKLTNLVSSPPTENKSSNFSSSQR